MTNFEFYREEMKDNDYDIVILIENHSEIQDKSMKEIMEWMYAEYTEPPIMLEQWEYVTLKACVTVYRDSGFYSFYTLSELKVAGHFRGITDTSMTLQEILDRAEIIDYNTCKGCKYEDVHEDDGACRSCCRWYEEDLYERE